MGQKHKQFVFLFTVLGRIWLATVTSRETLTASTANIYLLRMSPEWLQRRARACRLRAPNPKHAPSPHPLGCPGGAERLREGLSNEQLLLPFLMRGSFLTEGQNQIAATWPQKLDFQVFATNPHDDSMLSRGFTCKDTYLACTCARPLLSGCARAPVRYIACINSVLNIFLFLPPQQQQKHMYASCGGVLSKRSDHIVLVSLCH
jgi:hypothetical protein